MRKIFCFLTSVALLCGCASVGNNFDANKVSTIKKGETTEADLIKTFGQPSQRGINSEGTITLSWIYSEATAKGATFIPIVGAFAGGANVKTKILCVYLDQSGKVSRYDYSGGSTQAGAGTQSDSESSAATTPVKSPRNQQP